MSSNSSYTQKKSTVTDLPHDLYWVLTVLDLWEGEIKENIVYRVLNQAQVSSKAQRMFTAALVSKCIDQLVTDGYCVRKGSEVEIAADWKEIAARTALIRNPRRVRALVSQLEYQGLSRDHLYAYRIDERNAKKILLRLRLALYGNDAGQYLWLLNMLARDSSDIATKALARANAIWFPFDREFMTKRAQDFEHVALRQLYKTPERWDTATTKAIGGYLRHHPELLDSTSSDYLDMLVNHSVMCGNWKALSSINLSGRQKMHHQGMDAMRLLATGQWAEAKSLVEVLGHGKLPTNILGGIYLIYQARYLEIGKMKKIYDDKLRKVTRSITPDVFNALIHFYAFQFGDDEKAAASLLVLFEESDLHPLERLCLLWCVYWIGVTPDHRHIPAFEHLVAAFEANGLFWISGEMANALAHVWTRHPQRQNWVETAQRLAEQHQFQYLLGLVAREESWERALRSLEQIAATADAAQPAYIVGSKRLVWFINLDERKLQPKEQKLSKKGTWSAGRKINISNIFEQRLDSMTEQDKSVVAAIESTYYGQLNPHYSYSDYMLEYNFEHALYQLSGHPYVFIDERRQIPLTLTEAQPQLLITEEEGKVLLQFSPRTRVPGYLLEKETPTRYKVYAISLEQAQMSNAIGDGVEVPTEALPQLEAMTDSLRDKVEVQSTGGLIDEDLPQVPGSPKPCLHLLPVGDGFKLEFYVKPLPEESRYFQPGEGLARVVLENAAGDKVICERNLPAEQEQAEAVVAACPSLQQAPSEQKEWLIADTERCLQVLLELNPLRQADAITLEHPRGEKIRLSAITATDDLRVSVQKERDWFAVKGELQINEQEVMDFKKLLRHVQESDSLFIELRDGEFMALTEAFRDRLKEMDGMMHQRGQQLQLPTLAAQQLEAFSEELADFEADTAWRDSLSRIEKAQRIRPRLPKDFQAELRPYQRDGFRWLMRLAEWGVGGCLADDMGLGKTVQALALLTARRAQGPSLVIAPASVTRNWLREAERFTPSLQTKLLSSSKDAEMLDDLGPDDLLLVSYGLLPFIGEELSNIHFANVVLDEAQAIKNAATKRSKVAMKLQADFRLATTGTPIENHLGELWNLFRFLNPGLLGSKQIFTEKFAKPITRDGDKDRREHLRNLIRPFILRRRKDEVLTELPPKTEVTLTVELSPKERAFYEALRRNALEEIESADSNAKRFTVLSQLTKLRQAACHPMLVEARSRIESSKLELVGETIMDLLDNGHKALVFSQFVRHLRLVEQWVKAAKIPYRYLDGSTPSAKREQAVNDFQSGDGQLFLISLKAGGTGLNLTEADYVLHLDPWWNPAVEAQASDRAHRIGQQRPVTVYRFVSEDTIEEKIVALHQEKRELADQLLAGTDASAKLSMDQMLDLLRS